MESIKNIIKQQKQLPAGPAHDALCTIYPEYAEKHKQLLQIHYQNIICPLSTWGVSTSEIVMPPLQDALNFIKKQNPLVQQTENLQQLIRKYEQMHKQAPSCIQLVQRLHPRVFDYKPMKLMIEQAESPILNVKQLILNKKLPEFTPFMSTFPFIDPISDLKIQESQESKIPDLVYQYFACNPYYNFITENKPDYNQFVQEIACGDTSAILKFIQTFELQLAQNQQVDECCNLLNGFKKQQVVHLLNSLMHQNQRQILISQLLASKKPTFITTTDELNKLIVQLNTQTIVSIAIKTAQESYYGVTSYIIFSFNESDFIVDCLELVDQMFKLREFMVNPKILKLIFNSEDLLNLQRDFRIYSNCIFDCQLAAELLNKPRDFKELIKQEFQYTIPVCEQSFGLRMLLDGQIQELRLQTLFLPAIYEMLAQKVNQQTFETEQVKLLQLNYQNLRMQENQKLFDNLDNARNIVEMKQAFILLLADVVGRTSNRRINVSIAQIRSIIDGQQVGNLDPIFKLHIPLFGQLFDLAQNYYQLKSNEGQFNQLTYSQKVSAKNSFTNSTPLKWSEILTEIGWMTDSAQGEVYPQEITGPVDLQSFSTHVDSKSNVERVEIKQKVEEIIGVQQQMSLQQVLKGFMK
ncbi:Exosome_3'-5' exoribonuclease complex [Hexamita inflata]|uniref:Subunit Rrp6p n=1 Tax=Hexamita inflata TaxID=28002 RepID=A0AA86NZV7_9EUKA|nr:Exosome 3'-5' exoribonuclease complex [Hexamita inflata]